MSGKSIPKIRWSVTGASIRGANHARAHRPNQDAIIWQTGARAGAPAVLAIADGHGAARYVRSHRGAKLAVQIAKEILSDFADSHEKTNDLAAIAHLAAEQLPRTLVRTWQDQVRSELAVRPLSAAEEARWLEDRKPDAVRDPMRAYGSTLIAAVLTSRYLLFCHLGDGDILTVDHQGEVSRPPLPVDTRLVANQTTSLCGPDAWNDLRIYFQPLTERPPALVMLATDGYANSFADEQGFFATAGDLLHALQTNGVQHTTNRLSHWLHATSEGGSGDDISVGLAYRLSGLHA